VTWAWQGSFTGGARVGRKRWKSRLTLRDLGLTGELRGKSNLDDVFCINSVAWEALQDKNKERETTTEQERRTMKEKQRYQTERNINTRTYNTTHQQRKRQKGMTKNKKEQQ